MSRAGTSLSSSGWCLARSAAALRYSSRRVLVLRINSPTSRIIISHTSTKRHECFVRVPWRPAETQSPRLPRSPRPTSGLRATPSTQALRQRPKEKDPQGKPSTTTPGNHRRSNNSTGPASNKTKAVQGRGTPTLWAAKLVPIIWITATTTGRNPNGGPRQLIRPRDYCVPGPMVI